MVYMVEKNVAPVESKGWTLVKRKMMRFKCTECGREANVRQASKRKICKGCGAIFNRE